MGEKFKTDLNERERARFAADARSIQEQAGKLADALDSDDDMKIAIEFALLTLVSGSLKELQEVILSAAKQAKSGDAYLSPDESAARL